MKNYKSLAQNQVLDGTEYRAIPHTSNVANEYINN